MIYLYPRARASQTFSALEFSSRRLLFDCLFTNLDLKACLMTVPAQLGHIQTSATLPSGCIIYLSPQKTSIFREQDIKHMLNMPKQINIPSLCGSSRINIFSDLHCRKKIGDVLIVSEQVRIICRPLGIRIDQFVEH